MKFFIYLSDVGIMNGCMSYVPGSHRIGYLIRKGIYLKKLQYSSYWSLKQFRNFLAINNNYEYVKKNLDDDNLLDNFLSETENINDEEPTKFDYSASAGDAIIFDEGGIHRGSTPTKNDRMVIRYFLSPEENKDLSG